MGMFIGARDASWSVSSATDPRWDGYGSCRVASVFSMPREAASFIEARKKELGEEPPSDLEWSCTKD